MKRTLKLRLKQIVLASAGQALLIANVANAQNYQDANLKAFLKQLHDSPISVMDQLPNKIKRPGTVSVFTNEQVATGDYVKAKDKIRQGFCKSVEGTPLCLNEDEGRSVIEAGDSAADLVDNANSLIQNLSQMDSKKLAKKKLEVQPWSDDYWPIYAGILGKRYADEGKGYTSDWKEAQNYVESNPVSDYLEKDLVDVLSPSEKYDLLVGDTSGSLTAKMWAEGKAYYNQNGKVETWMGICHGWAPASFMLPRPGKTVSVLAADGKTVINFYPSDIKALSSLLWANARVPSNFTGSRCNTKDPKKDADSGRIIDQGCFDTNPGSWHQAIVNQIGVSGRSFVMDATYDYEVWNQPVLSYDYHYFNVDSAETGASWKKLAIPMTKYAKDPFKKYRNSQAKYVVGVEMVVEYMVETSPDHEAVNTPENDSTSSAVYRYDLELDADGNILGGEWYSNAHPDFMWVPPVGSRAKSQADAYATGTWAKRKNAEGQYLSVPQAWKTAAPYAAKNGLPLAKVVEGLIERANAN